MNMSPGNEKEKKDKDVTNQRKYSQMLTSSMLVFRPQNTYPSVVTGPTVQYKKHTSYVRTPYRPHKPLRMQKPGNPLVLSLPYSTLGGVNLGSEATAG